MASIRKLHRDEILASRLPANGAPAPGRVPLFGLLDNIRSLYNVGSIFRTSDGADLAHLYLTGYTPAPPRNEISKTALGATETVPWSHHRDPFEAIALARGRGARICLLEHTTASIPYTALHPRDFPLCLVVGNELTGISPAIVDAADLAVEIPMFGSKLSLNVAVAFGIAVFELGRVFREGKR